MISVRVWARAAGWQAGWLAHWLAGWLAGSLFDLSWRAVRSEQRASR
tara:strand:+ start:768 stop:908 length:141 start_codon:yes stop_codon:yes gene_type:complete